MINFENILSVKLFHDDEDNECLYEIYTTVNAPRDNYILLGEYNTEERAMEVLQEIITTYSDFEAVRNAPNKRQAIIMANAEYKYFDVYEMPKS